ncbi:MAG: hypothetical protein ACREUA_03090 [Burkholderiales bacterium]
MEFPLNGVFPHRGVPANSGVSEVAGSPSVRADARQAAPTPAQHAPGTRLERTRIEIERRERMRRLSAERRRVKLPVLLNTRGRPQRQHRRRHTDDEVSGLSELA